MTQLTPRHELESKLKGETLGRKGLMRKHAGIVPLRLVPDLNVVKIGGHGIIDFGREVVLPLMEEIGELSKQYKILAVTGGGVRVRHILDIGIDLGMPTGVLAELAAKISEQNAEIVTLLLSKWGGSRVKTGDLLDLPTLLHLGPGLANALANFHNARKARSPVVNIVGEHSTQHRGHDAPLTADTEAFARPVSGWVRTLERATAMGEAASAAVVAALGPPGQVASLIIPADFSWSEAGEPGGPAPRPALPLPAAERLRDIAALLRSPQAVGLLLSGSALQARGLRAAERLRAATGIKVFADRYAARTARGAGIPPVERLPYFPEPAQALLAGFQRLILVEAQPPVSFFGYPGLRSSLAPVGCAFDVLASEDQDGVLALEWLAQELDARPSDQAVPGPPRPTLPRGESLTATAVGRANGRSIRPSINFRASISRTHIIIYWFRDVKALVFS